MARAAAFENAGTTDTDTQSDASGELSTPDGIYKRRVLVGVSTGICFALAVGGAVATTRKSTVTSQWKGANEVSKAAGYAITKDTGCSDWAAQKVGDMLTAISDLDCLNKCLDVPGATYANYQSASCHDASLGAKSGACYCFSGCTMVGNTCWDLISTSAVGLDAPTTEKPTPQVTLVHEASAKCGAADSHDSTFKVFAGSFATPQECAEEIIAKRLPGECSDFFIHAPLDAAYHAGQCDCCTETAPVDGGSTYGGVMVGYEIELASASVAAASAVAGSTTTSTTGVR